MSPPGRPKGEYRSAQREGNPLRPIGSDRKSGRRSFRPLTNRKIPGAEPGA